MWICQACGADVQDDWDVCWNCTRARDGRPLPESDVPSTTEPFTDETEMKRGLCPKCHSNTIMPNVRVSDFLAGNTRQLWLTIPENPHALIFKNLVPSAVRAWVCGRCGYTEFYAEEPALLWDTYQRSLLADNEVASTDEESGSENES